MTKDDANEMYARTANGCPQLYSEGYHRSQNELMVAKYMHTAQKDAYLVSSASNGARLPGEISKPVIYVVELW